MADDDRRWDRRWDQGWRDAPRRERARPDVASHDGHERNWDDWRAREREEGRDGRGYGGLNEWSYRDRGQGRMFDRGEDYGRAAPRDDAARAGEPPRGQPRDAPRRGPDRGRW